MSRLVQIDAAKFDGGAQKLFSSRNQGQTLSLQDDQGAIIEVTLEDFYTSSTRRKGGPVRTFEAFVRELDGNRTVFRYAALRVYKGYGRVLLQVE